MDERQGPENFPKLDPLNARELQILGLMAKGLSNSEIAHQLSLSQDTVKWYNKHIYSKLGVNSRTQAVAKAGEYHLLTTQAATPQVMPAKKEPRGDHNLPGSITSFIGREKEIREVATLVSMARLVTITGAGGLGKTRLAVQVAEQLAATFIHGARWVTFAALFDSTTPGGSTRGDEVVSQAVAKALRVFEQPGKPLLQGVLDDLSGKNLLLVLDNCEHLIAPCAALAENILTHCPQVTVLVTSREALGVPGEKVWRLPPLSLPASQDASGGVNTFTAEAVRLFIERATDALPSFQPELEDAPILAKICQHLDGIPLAIELAAARMNLLSLDEIAARLDRLFSLLTGGHRTALPRHQTLLAAIEWSYGLLSEAEQVLFRRLSVFSGSFILEAAETICAGPDLPGDRVLTLLGRLVDKSLINVVPSAQHTGLVTRYRFLDTIHSFGRRKLEEANETGWMHRTHASYYVRLVENAEPELFLPDQGRWFMLLKAEYDNLRAAMQWTVAVGEAEAALRLVGALIWFWFFYGSWRDGLELSMNALSVPTIPHLGSLRARALNTAGVLHWFLGDAVTARVLLDEAVRLAQQFNDDMNLALSLQMRGLVFISEGEYQLGDSAMKEGLALAKKLEDDKSMFFALAFQGDIVLERGDRAKAQEIYAESIRLLRSFGDKYFLGYPLRRLGYLALGQDQFGAAWHYFHDSLTLNREIGDQRAVTACLLSMASLALQIDQPEMAVVLFGVVDTRIESLTTNLMLLDQVKVGMVREQIQARLGKERFVSGLNEGAELSEEQLMALVKVLEGAVKRREKRV